MRIRARRLLKRWLMAAVAEILRALLALGISALLLRIFG